MLYFIGLIYYNNRNDGFSCHITCVVYICKIHTHALLLWSAGFTYKQRLACYVATVESNVQYNMPCRKPLLLSISLPAKQSPFSKDACHASLYHCSPKTHGALDLSALTACFALMPYVMEIISQL